MSKKVKHIPVNSMKADFGTGIFVGKMSSEDFQLFEQLEEIDNIEYFILYFLFSSPNFTPASIMVVSTRTTPRRATTPPCDADMDYLHEPLC